MLQNMEVLIRMGKFTGITELAIQPDATNYVPISKCRPVSTQLIIDTPETIQKWVTTRKMDMSAWRFLSLMKRTTRLQR